MSKYFLIITLLFLIILNKLKLGLCEECEAAFYIPSELEPIDEVQLLVNETLIIYCKLLNVTNECHSSHLVFQNKNGQNLSNNYKIRDNSTIELFIENMTAFNSVYNCKYNNEEKNKVYGLGQVAVRVGYKPKILNFSCFSINLGPIECTIEQISNPLIINYKLEFGPTDNFNNSSYRISTVQFSIEEENKVRFTIGACSRAYKFCYVQIHLDNGFGTDLERYWIDVKRITKPIIENLSVVNITSKSAILLWSLSPLFQNIKFEHQIKICQSRQNCIENASDSWRYIYTKNEMKLKEINETTFQLKITLGYAYTWYDIQVSTCVRDALYTDLWSHANGTVFRTLKRTPDSPPEAAMGGFEILPNNETKIYWKEIPLNRWNADYMSYEIVEVLEDGDKVLLQPEYNENNTTAKFHGLQHTEHDYQFKIISRNSEGNSTEYSVITIPRTDKILPKPNDLKKRLSNSIYTLTWKYTYDFLPNNYTIFWCDPIDEQGTLCDKLINFVYVNAGNTFIYNNTQDKKTKIFAISLNYKEKTSGMTWFPCSVTENQDMTIFPADLVVLSATQLNISWSPQCATPLLKGFNISYCPIYNQNSTDCNETKLYSDVSNSYYIIENLVAYTTYLVKISMFDGKKSGPIVEFRKVTDSCQPTVPYDFGYESITNSTINLKWNPPDYWNGEPQFYNITYKLINRTSHQYQENSTKVEKLNDGYLPRSFKLENLHSYSDYIIKIAGCNPACSNFSNEIKIQTLIGKPGVTDIFESHTEGDMRTYSWLPPALKAGNLDFYEILFEGKIDSEYKVLRKIQLNSTVCTVNKLLYNNLCENHNIIDFKLWVRAINIVDGYVHHTNRLENNSYQFDSIKCAEEDDRINFECGTKYDCIASDWKQGPSQDCPGRSDKVAIITIASFCIGLGMLIGFLLVCNKVQQLKDVGKPELPEGLEDIMEAKPPLNNNLMHNKPNEILEDEQKTRLISESKSIDDTNYMDNVHFDCEADYSYNSDNLLGEKLSSKQSITNFLNMVHTDLEIPYGYEIEAKPIINYVSDSNYDGESISQLETMSYDSTQSINDSNIQSVLTDSTNTDTNYTSQPPASYIINSPPLITTNGYVRVSDLKPKPPVSNGYFSIADLPIAGKKNMIWPPTNGYVKPKDLVDFENNRSPN